MGFVYGGSLRNHPKQQIEQMIIEITTNPNEQDAKTIIYTPPQDIA